MPMKKKHDFMYGFKPKFTSNNEQLFKLEGCLHSRRKNKIKKFPPFGNEFFTLIKNISLKAFPIMYPLK